MFGWENFLSERDREHDQIRGKREPAGFGTRPALLLIDIYYSVLGFEREPIFKSMETWPMSTGLEGWAAVDRCAELLAAARKFGIPVFHAKGLHTGVNPWGRGGMGRSARLTPEMIARGNEIVDEVRPVPGEYIVEKAAASAFFGTPLEFQLISLGIDTIICGGETTSGCVRASVVDGATRRYNMGVVAECVFDRTESSHYLNLYDMHQKYADVISLESALAYFESVASERRAASGSTSSTAAAKAGGAA